MKILITETQYERLITEQSQGSDTLVGEIDNSVVKIFNGLHKMNVSSIEEAFKVLERKLNIDKNRAHILSHNYMRFYPWKGGDYSDLMGEELEFYGEYELKTLMPTVITSRVLLPGVVSVMANSKEHAIQKAITGEFDEYDMYISDFVRQENVRKEMDFDLDTDAEPVKDMVVDYLHMDFDEGRLKINLKI
jgi:hypothetical protein